MSTYGGKELAKAFRTVRKNTVQVAEDIPEEKYSFVAAPGVKPVAHMLTHVALVTGFWDEVHNKRRLTTMVGFDFAPLMEKAQADEAKTRSKKEVVELLRKNGEEFAGWLETLTPEFLGETLAEPDGTSKSRFESLLGAKEHEMHHRAQLMLIERQLGIVPHITRQRMERMEQMRAAKA
jgi:uncharacterized damage-inducible protein DinB